VEVFQVELQPDRLWKPGTFFPEIKRQTTENDHSPSGKVKNAWSYTSTPSCLHGLDMPTSYTRFTIWEISCYSLSRVVDTVWRLQDHNKTPARILIPECIKLYRCTVHLDIDVCVHQLMHLFISPREHWNLLKIHTRMLLHVSVYDHHQGPRTWT